MTAAVALTGLAALIFDLISVKAVAAKCVVFFIDIHSYIKYTVHRGLPLYAVIPVALPSIVSVKAKLFCPEIAGLFCRIAGLFCHDSRANLSLKPVCFGIAIS